jgi:hypothetical protein
MNKRIFFMRFLHHGWGVALILLICAGWKGVVEAQTLTISGDLFLTVSSGSSIAQPPPVVNSGITLTYNVGANFSGINKKITVSRTVTNNRYNLKTHAINISANGGTAQSAIDLSISPGPVDFIRDIPWWSWIGGNKMCNLEYTVTATYAQGCSDQNGGNTIFNVTYTLLNQ